MSDCKLYPQFTISGNWATTAEYRKVGCRCEKRGLMAMVGNLEDEGWRECSRANYALALLTAHEQAAEE